MTPTKFIEMSMDDGASPGLRNPRTRPGRLYSEIDNALSPQKATLINTDQ